MATPTRRRPTPSGYPRKTRNVKSSTMKGASSPCQSAAAETEPGRERPDQEGQGGASVFCPLKSVPRWDCKPCRGGSLGNAWSAWTRRRPTDVTAAAKDQTNRARSVAAGVVSGAGEGPPVIEKPHSDESAPSRTRHRLDPGPVRRGRRGWGVVPARQLGRRVRADGWCRAYVHTRKE